MTPMSTMAAPASDTPGHAGDRPLAIAVAASLLLHAFLAGGLGAIYGANDAASGRRETGGPVPELRAILVSAPSPSPSPESPTPPSEGRVAEPATALAAAAAASPPAPPPASTPGIGAAGAHAVVEIAELRGAAPLGGEFDRRIAEEFAVDPDQSVQLAPGATFGYPAEALASGTEGRVLLWVVVGPKGDVEEKEALDGPPVLAEHVLARIDGMIGGPAMVGGRAVRHWLALDIVFAIREDAPPAQAPAAAAARRGP